MPSARSGDDIKGAIHEQRNGLFRFVMRVGKQPATEVVLNTIFGIVAI